MAMVLGMVTPSEEVQQKSKGTVKRVIAYKLGEDEIDGANVNLILKFAGDEPCSLFKQSQIALILQNTRFALQLTGAQNGEARLQTEVNRMQTELEVVQNQMNAMDAEYHHLVVVSEDYVHHAVRLLDQGNIQEARRVLDDHFLAPQPPESADDDSDPNDEPLVCVLCRQYSPIMMYQMAPEGRWANLEPGARVVCFNCYEDTTGRPESFW